MFIICPKCASKYQIPQEIKLKQGQKVKCSACQHIFNFQNSEDVLNESSDFQPLIPEDPVLADEKIIVHEEKITHTHELPEVFKPLESVPKQTSSIPLWVISFMLIILFFVCGIWFYRDMMTMDYFDSSSKIASIPRINQFSDHKTKRIVKTSLDQKNLNTEAAFFPKEEGHSFVDAEKANNVFLFHTIHFHYEPTGILIQGIMRNMTDTPQHLPPVIYATAFNEQGQVLFKKEILLPKEILPPYGQKEFFGTYTPAPNGVQWIEVSCEN